MKIKMDYFDAFDQLDVFATYQPTHTSDQFNAERYAIITHWLQSETRTSCPPYVSKQHIKEWELWLRARAIQHTRRKRHNESDERKFRIKKRMFDPINDLSNHTLLLCLKNIPFPPPKKPVFSFIDLFAGIGGFRLALQQNGGQCVFSSEIDKKAREVYFNNFGEYPFGDLTQFTGSHISDSVLDALIPYHDVLSAGFPCQPFSRAGVSARNALGTKHGLECEDKGNLFFDLMRIVKVKQPKVLLLENTSGITSHDKGRTFSIIKKTIKELGYSFSYGVVDSSSMVPQKRKRCYMICFRNPDAPFHFLDEWFEGDRKALKTILVDEPDPVHTISDRLWAGHKRRSKRNKERGTGFVANLADINAPSNTLVARYGKDGKECLIPQVGKNPRMLTIEECASLQGFPDGFIPADARTPAYKQFGNSVVVPVVSLLTEKIIPYLNNL